MLRLGEWVSEWVEVDEWVSEGEGAVVSEWVSRLNEWVGGRMEKLTN